MPTRRKQPAYPLRLHRVVVVDPKTGHTAPLSPKLETRSELKPETFTGPMHPLSLKFTTVQMDRLLKARSQTGRRQTELIRNAVDAYLDKLGV